LLGPRRLSWPRNIRHPIAPAFNAVAAKLIDVPVLGNVVRRNLVVISYVGRRDRDDQGRVTVTVKLPSSSSPATG
jgi:hypothetical protein